MAKYHVNESGNTGQCRAEKGNCPFGGAEAHYETAQEARAAYEAKMDDANVALKSIHKEIGERRAAKRASINGLEIVNRKTGRVESFTPMNPDELSMPGYLESVEKSYDGTQWEARRSYEQVDERDDAYGEYCFVCLRATDHTGEHEAEVEAGYAVYENGNVMRTAAYDENFARVLREASFQAYDSKFDLHDPTNDSEELKAARAELVRLENSPGRTQYGFPEDEMTRYNIEQAIKAQRAKVKELDPSYDPAAEKRALAAQESLATVIANARFKADPRNRREPVPEIEIKDGSAEYTNVVVAEIQVNKELPGTTPQNRDQVGRKKILIPNMNRLTTNKKLAIADELYADSGHNLVKWASMTDEAKLRWLESRMNKYKSLTVVKDGDKVSWSNPYSSSHNSPAEDVRMLSL